MVMPNGAAATFKREPVAQCSAYQRGHDEIGGAVADQAQRETLQRCRGAVARR